MRALIIIYPNGSHLAWFPQGAAHVAAWIDSDDGESVIYDMTANHFNCGDLKRYLDRMGCTFDMVGLGGCAGYWQHQQMVEISEAVNTSKHRGRFKYVLGGHGPAADPDYFKKKMGADDVVVGDYEPEGTHIDAIPTPPYVKFDMSYYRLVRFPGAESCDFVAPLLTSRGCPFKCNFCYRMVDGVRLRSVDGIMEELAYLQAEHGINYIYFWDELTMVGPQRTEELCRAFIKHRPRFKWACNGRLNYAKPDLLGLMREAGCVFINYGIEALDDETLTSMSKNLTVGQIGRGVEATLAEGISPGLNIMWGNPLDSKATLRKAVDFLVKHDDGAQLRTIRPVTPYPGSALFDTAVKEGRIKDVADFYERAHTNSDLCTAGAQWTGLPDDEFHACLLDANTELLANYHEKKRQAETEQFKRLYSGDASFRGLRQT